MRRLVWFAQKIDGKKVEQGGGESVSGISEFELFSKKLDQLSDLEKREFEKRASQLNARFTFGSVDELRRGGLSEEDESKDPEKKYLVLAGQYLKRDKKDREKFEVDFKGNYLAEFKAIGWSHVFPWTVDEIKVFNQEGELLVDRAVRMINPENGKEGYYVADLLEQTPPVYEYVYMYSGYKVEIVKTVSASEAELKKEKELKKKEIIGVHQKRKYQMAAAGNGQRNILIDRQLSEFSDRKANSDQLIESVEMRGMRDRIVQRALYYGENPQLVMADFRKHEMLKGGSLGCAWVVSSILKDLGLVDRKIPGVDTTMEELQKRGWRLSREQPEPGDVVVWERLPGRKIIKSDGGEDWKPGHRHIGIVVGSNLVVDNSGSDGPKIKPLFRTRRGVEFILKPPV